MERTTIYEHAQMLDNLRRDLTTLARQVGNEFAILPSDEEEHARRKHLIRAQVAVWDAAESARFAAIELRYLHTQAEGETIEVGVTS